MEELIKKNDFIAEIKNTMPQGASRGVFLALIDDAPTTTEAEIRASVIEEFAEKLIALFCYEPPVPNKWKMDNIYEGESIKEIITEVAEQLKEE